MDFYELIHRNPKWIRVKRKKTHMTSVLDNAINNGLLTYNSTEIAHAFSYYIKNEIKNQIVSISFEIFPPFTKSLHCFWWHEF